MPPQTPPRGSEDDLRLARACADGDSEVFASIYDRHGERMKSIAYHQLGNVSDAEDAVQETFIKVHRAAASYNGEAAFTTWLYRILINTCYDMLRKRSRRIRETPIDDLPHAGHAANAVDDVKRIALRKLLHELPEQRRTVFALFEIEGLSHAEIAGILDITEGNSKWILFSTKKQLQEQWKKS
ncbi:MAG TPA: RNA polymerase sigma factor [Thermoanaerobaculia bacterium]|nr:RNA polymerase sigma factor [Thermoanaerobaculia bacterium]